MISNVAFLESLIFHHEGVLGHEYIYIHNIKMIVEEAKGCHIYLRYH